MDRVVGLIVRCMCTIARWGSFVIPGYAPVPPEKGEPIKILLVGYNGARNTGSDVRVAALARQILDTFEKGVVELSVMTLDENSTAPYFEGIAHQVPFKTIFFKELLVACSQNHVIVLCEGSTLKSKFANALTLYTCQAAGIAKAQDKPCVAVGSEIGQMDSFIKRAAINLCSEVQFICRSTTSLYELRTLGLTGHKGTDTAWTFESSLVHDQACEILMNQGWDTSRPLLGIAPINPFCWPVVPSLPRLAQTILTKDHDLQFKSWYFFSWSAERNRKFEQYLDALASATITFCAERGFQPVIIGMEQLDKQACEKLHERLERANLPSDSIPIILSHDTDGFVIAEVLRSLSLLLTSRYHAQVLASHAAVPSVAVSMDERLDNLDEEFSLPEELLLHVDDADLAPQVLLALDYAQDNRDQLSSLINTGREEALRTINEMNVWFKTFVEQRFAAR